MLVPWPPNEPRHRPALTSGPRSPVGDKTAPLRAEPTAPSTAASTHTDEAHTLHTTGAARLTGKEHLRGTLTPGRFADLTVWDHDPACCPGDVLRDLNPTHTFVGGLLVTPADTR